MSEALPRPRPTFELASSFTPEEVRRRVSSFLKTNERIKGLALPDRVELAFARKEQHLWSPQLIVDLAKDGQGCRLSARFGPHPHVWTMYTAVYFILGIFGLLSGAYGYSQTTLGQPPTALWAIPGLVALAALTYGVPFIGQGLGFDQMYQLRNKLTELTEAHETDAPAPKKTVTAAEDAEG